jgi:CRISPR-associated protein Cmr3
MSSYLTITPRDPVIVRDARPFSFGIRMKSLDWPYPSVLAGSLRTLLGKEVGGDFNQKTVQDLKAINIAGPLAVYRNTLYFPAPKDLLVEGRHSGEYTHHLLRPMDLHEGEWCDLPHKSLRLAMMPEDAPGEFKPEKFAQLWSVHTMTEWLTQPEHVKFVSISSQEEDEDTSKRVYAVLKPDGSEDRALDSLDLPEKDARTHVWIDPETGRPKVGMLFETMGLDLSLKKLPGQVEFAARVHNTGQFTSLVNKMDTLHPFGGERRLSHWKAGERHMGWICPEKIQHTLSGKQKVRMVLATPAIFSGGWIPGWLAEKDEKLTGSPPGAPDGLSLRLVSACVDRWKPLSGWSLEKGNVGPKPIRRVVPAGSVYFFEINGGMDAAALAKNCWLVPVSDDPEQNRRDGFGLALWGSWNNDQENDE